jgi:hypothetical protein
VSFRVAEKLQFNSAKSTSSPRVSSDFVRLRAARNVGHFSFFAGDEKTLDAIAGM